VGREGGREEKSSVRTLVGEAWFETGFAP